MGKRSQSSTARFFTSCLDGGIALVAIGGKPVEHLGDHVADGLELGDAEAARGAGRRARAECPR